MQKKYYVIFRYVRPILAMLIVAGSFAFMFSILYKEIPERNVETVNLVVGFMLGITASVGAYYFGTSKDKSDTEQSQREVIAKPPVVELIAKCKDITIPLSEREEWLKKLQEHYPEYVGKTLSNL